MKKSTLLWSAPKPKLCEEAPRIQTSNNYTQIEQETMTYKVDLKPSGERDLKKLPLSVQKAVSLVIDSLKQNPRPVGVQKLSGYNLYRLRVEKHYRFIYEIDDKAKTVLVLIIGPRWDVYKNLRNF